MLSKNKTTYYIVLYMIICISWAGITNYNLSIDTPILINFISILLGIAFLHGFYICFIQRESKTISVRPLWITIPIFFIGISILQERNIPVLCTAFALTLLLIICNLIYQTNRVNWISVSFIILASIFLYLGEHLFIAMSGIISIVIDTKWRYNYKKLSSINLMPISKDNQKKVLPLLIIFLTITLYFLNLTTIGINIIFHAIIISYILFLLVNIEEVSKSYEDMESFYLLAVYLNEERDEFSRIIHDEIIQDLKASQYLINLKNPDFENSSKILIELENKSRRIMNYYSNSIFEDYTILENIENIITSIKTLYPHQNIDINSKVDNNATNSLAKEKYKLVLQIIKELINNIYKHSNATYIHYNITMNNENELIIHCESDGSTANDFENIKKSKGGVLILKVLLKKNRGKIDYSFDDGRLTTKICLNLEVLDENNYFGRS